MTEQNSNTEKQELSSQKPSSKEAFIFVSAGTDRDVGPLLSASLYYNGDAPVGGLFNFG